MTSFRMLVIVLFAILAIYTAFVVPSHGLNFIPTFVGDMGALGWRGQVNIDFMSYLIITAVWVAWRHKFSFAGIILGIIVLFGAMLLFAPYLLWAISRSGGDIKVLLMGEN